MGWATEPVVSNVRATQLPDTKLVDILYDLLDADGDPMTVSIMIENTASDTQIHATSFTGDIGQNIFSGTDKHVVSSFRIMLAISAVPLVSAPSATQPTNFKVW